MYWVFFYIFYILWRGRNLLTRKGRGGGVPLFKVKVGCVWWKQAAFKLLIPFSSAVAGYDVGVCCRSLWSGRSSSIYVYTFGSDLELLRHHDPETPAPAPRLWRQIRPVAGGSCPHRLPFLDVKDLVPANPDGELRLMDKRPCTSTDWPPTV